MRKTFTTAAHILSSALIKKHAKTLSKYYCFIKKTLALNTASESTVEKNKSTPRFVRCFGNSDRPTPTPRLYRAVRVPQMFRIHGVTTRASVAKTDRALRLLTACYHPHGPRILTSYIPGGNPG